MLQPEAMAPENVPAEHVVQELAVAADHDPAPQFIHEDDPPVEKVPGVQLV